jgi:hypothetical protein
VTLPTTREVCVRAEPTFLYNVVLDADLDPFLEGHTICLVGADQGTNPIGEQDAFDVQFPVGFFRVITDQPNQATCTPPFVHATVRSGTPFVGQIPLTQVCIRFF